MKYGIDTIQEDKEIDFINRNNMILAYKPRKGEIIMLDVRYKREDILKCGVLKEQEVCDYKVVKLACI